MRLSKFLSTMTEMARSKGDAIKAVLAWAARQNQPFTIRQAYEVYTANGGRANTEGDNIQSFTTQFQKMVAKEWKQDDKPKHSKAPYWPPSKERPLVNAVRGSRGRDAGTFVWAPNVPKPSDDARFVNPSDDEPVTGDAMDRLEKVLSMVRSGLPDEKQGREKLKAAMARWKGMKDLNKVVADIRATIPKKGQMDALHIASEFLLDRGAADEEEVEDAEDEVAPAPQQDDDDDFGDFSDDPEPEDDEEEEEPSPTFQRTPTAKVRPEPEEEPEELGSDDVEDVEDDQNDVPPGKFKEGDRVKRNWAGVSPKDMARITPAVKDKVGTITRLVPGKSNSGRAEPAAKIKWDGDAPGEFEHTFLLSELELVDDTGREAGAQNFLQTPPPSPKPAAPAPTSTAAKKPSIGSLMKKFKK